MRTGNQEKFHQGGHDGIGWLYTSQRSWGRTFLFEKKLHERAVKTKQNDSNIMRILF